MEYAWQLSLVWDAHAVAWELAEAATIRPSLTNMVQLARRCSTWVITGSVARLQMQGG